MTAFWLSAYYCTIRRASCVRKADGWRVCCWECLAARQPVFSPVSSSQQTDPGDRKRWYHGEVAKLLSSLTRCHQCATSHSPGAGFRREDTGGQELGFLVFGFTFSSCEPFNCVQFVGLVWDPMGMIHFRAGCVVCHALAQCLHAGWMDVGKPVVRIIC